MTKRIPKELFELNSILDNPYFEGFGFKDEIDELPSLLGRESFDDDLYPAYDSRKVGRQWKPARLSKLWTPASVEGRVQPYHDFPCVDLSYPAFSKRACDVLQDMLKPNGELLPLISESSEYYFYNITTVVDALDFKKSKGTFFSDDSWLALEINHYVFNKKKLVGCSIFRIPEDPSMTIVTDEFVKRVQESGLNGFEFRKIWPLPKGTIWQVEAKKKAKKKNKAKKMLKQHTLVIMLMLSGKKPNAKEKKKIKNLENELDAQLTITSLDAPLFGLYEGNDIVDNEYRLFLTCPDVDALTEKLTPWLNELGWFGDVYAMKRYGDMYDEDAEEELLEF